MTPPVDIRTIQGLTESEARKRLKSDGYNELPTQKKKNPIDTIITVLKEPMLLLLLGAGTIYFLLGEPKDALMLLTFVFVVVGITFYQERKTERALEALRDLSSPRALVIRDGQQTRIAGREVVRDDILILREGDRVPADIVILSATNLLLDESLLTGESMPVRKSEWDGKKTMERPGGEDLPFAYSGTMVVQGRGIGKVLTIGVQTEMGKIGKALETIKEENTLLQKETGKLVSRFTIIGGILCFLVIVVYGLTRGDWLKGFLAGLTLSMAMVPEEFPVVMLIFMTLGAWRMSKRHVLTRKTPVIETLGAATVLCVDKTGTLTHNRMKLFSLVSNGLEYDFRNQKKDLPEKFHAVLEYALLASQKDPFDPIEREIRAKSDVCLMGTEHIHKRWTLLREYPLSKELLALSHVWESPGKKDYIIAAKGAPEAIADLCHLGKKERETVLQTVKKMAGNGLRVIAVANAEFQKTSLPSNQHEFKFKFIGYLGFMDPVRASVASAIAESYAAGVRVIMITGDYPGTAQYIAKQIGLNNFDDYITGPQLSAMKPAVLRERIRTVNIFARVVPEQKLAIIDALKANHEIVAMTGDGVNDAPALKSAHIGIAMGERGTDVAREASDLVLLNDDFTSIVAAIRLGRRIFDNLKKSMSYIIAVHVPIAGMSFLPVLFDMPVVLLPAHIAFLELIIDPACSVVFEKGDEEPAIMKRPPRNLKEPLFSRKTFAISFLQGFSVLSIVFTVFLYSISQGKGELEARTLTFVTLVFSNLLLIVTNLSWSNHLIRILRSTNRTTWAIICGSVIFLLIILYVPFLRGVFHFAPLHADDLVVTFIAGVTSIIWFEVLKVFRRQS